MGGVWQMYIMILKKDADINLTLCTCRYVYVCAVRHATRVKNHLYKQVNFKHEPNCLLLPLTSWAGQSTGNSACSGLPFTVK